MLLQEVLKNIKLETLKKYVVIGLIGAPQTRNIGGKVTSRYPDDTLEKLKRIKRLKKHGYSLKEIKNRFDMEKEVLEEEPISLNNNQRRIFSKDKKVLLVHLDKYIYPLVDKIEGELKEELMKELASLDLQITQTFSRYEKL